MLILILAMAVGAGVIGWSWWRVAQQKKAAANWPHVDGRITRSDLTQRRDADGSLDYLPDIHYTYAVNGTPFEGKRVRYGLMRLDQKGATAIRTRYPEGDVVKVFYNPANPSDSVLETGAVQ